VKTLPPALQRSYVTLSPRTAERVDFLHLHDVARQVLEERDLAVRVTPPHCTAFDVAWRRCGGPFTKVGLTSSYFRDEISHVIKGRGLESEDEYLRVDRMGRGTPLRADARRAVWTLFEDYEHELRSQGLVDSVDVLRLARDAVRLDPDRTWAGVLVDEAQDIPLVGLQLLHELAGRDRHDGLLLIGDGQQAIYPGGYRLKDAGIDVSGRAVILDRNYRNTVEILATASAVVAADRFDDLEASDQPAERLVEVVRHGQLPTVGTHESDAAMDEALVWDVSACLGSGAVAAEVAVLVPTNRLVEHYLAVLRSAGLECVALASAKDEQAVRVGTWHRSKGMEFAHVFMPAADSLGKLLSGSGTAAEAEKAELLRRAKYVAMTRARDTLWVGSAG
jgi:superfamily I DNA/RNA helicase